uniref:Secreted protein n=1 Tax=Panagrolaimus sp. JU765 TaxID=591449 RepID=A0AC34Q157_9BILA
MMTIVKIVVFTGFIFSISNVFAAETVQAASEVKLEPQQYTTTAPQCKCKDIDACTEQMLSKAETVQAASEVKLEPQQYTTTAPQCKCKDIDACTEQMLSKVDKCKIS